MKTLSVWQGMVLLSAATLIAKVLSAFYRVPFQNMAGNIGFYVYQQVYPLYGIVAMLAMYGFPVVLSKERAALAALRQPDKARQLTSILFYGLLVFVTFSWCVLYSTADMIAFIMGDVHLSAPIRAMSFILFLLPFLSIGRGYHQGNEELVPTAVSHVSDQLVRVLLILGFTYFLVRSGADAYQIGSGAAWSSVLSGMVGLIVLMLITKGASFRQLIPPWRLKFSQLLSLNKSLLKQSGFICLSALVLVLFQLFDAFSFIRLLQSYGVTFANALEQKGIYDRGLPIIQLGTVLTTTISLALVPMLAKAVTEGNDRLAKQYQYISYRLTFLISGAAALGIIVIMKETNHMLFTDTAGTNVLRILAIAIGFNSFFVTLAATFQGYHLEKFPALAVCYGFMIKAVGNMVFIPLYGKNGAAIATLFALAIMVASLFIRLKKERKLFLGNGRAYAAIGLLLFIMGTVTTIWRFGLMSLFVEPSRITDAMIAISTVFVGCIVIFIGVLRLPIFSEQEWSEIPVLDRIKEKLVKR